ncbi:hypothetical protein BJF78_29435 [Pseudonocardia sp. CNS-139]|nr:hypothetical protein BJF78_29435 [Pseudonocardia sp. CNS-139]
MADSSHDYNAFISYGRASDAALAPVLRDSLNGYARPAFRPRAIRTFCDTRSLAAGGGVESSLRSHLDRAEHFVLVASPASAQSEWVAKELRWWLETRSADQIVIVHTERDDRLDPDSGDFDWARTDALPALLRGTFDESPLRVDLRGMSPDALSMRDPRWSDAIATIAARLLGRDKDELVGEDLRQYRRAVRFRRASVSGLVVLTVFALVATVVAVVQRDAAVTEARRALAGQMIAQSNERREAAPREGLLFALAAHEVDPTPASRAALLSAVAEGHYRGELRGRAQPVRATAFSPDGRILAGGDSAHRVYLWDRATRTRLAEMAVGGDVFDLRFTDSGMLVVAAGGTTSLWDVGNAAAPVRLSTIPTEEWSFIDSTLIAVRADGTLLVTGGGGLRVTTWDISRPRSPRRLAGLEFEEGPVYSMDLDAEGGVLAIGTYDYKASILTVDPAGVLVPRTEVVVDGPFDGIYTVDFSRTGRRLAMSSGTSVFLTDLANLDQPARLARLDDHADRVLDLELSPGGRLVVTAGMDNVATVWDITAVEHARVITTLRGHGDYVGAVAFDPTGGEIATGSDDGLVRLWGSRSPGSPLLRSSTTWGSPGRAVTLVGDGPQRTAVYGSASNALTIVDFDPWVVHSTLTVPANAKARQTVATLGFGGVSSLDAAGRRSLLAVAGNGDTGELGRIVTLYDIADLAAPRVLSVIERETDTFDPVVFSPDGGLLAIGVHHWKEDPSSAEYVELWDVRDPAAPRMVSTLKASGRSVQSVTFTPDGTAVVAAGQSDDLGEVGFAEQWDVRDPTRPLPLPPFTAASGINNAVAAGGELVVTGGTDGNAQVWTRDPDHRPVPRGRLVGHTGAMRFVAVNPTGSLVATAAEDGEIRLWDTADPDRPVLLGRLSAHLAVATSLDFSPDGAFVVSAAADGLLGNWDLSDLYAVIRDPEAAACAVLGPDIDRGPLPEDLDAEICA